MMEKKYAVYCNGERITKKFFSEKHEAYDFLKDLYDLVGDLIPKSILGFNSFCVFHPDKSSKLYEVADKSSELYDVDAK